MQMTEMISPVEKLAAVLRTLERAHAVAFESFQDPRYPEIDPYTIVDQNGRHMLLDSLVAIVNAQTALVNHRRD